MYRNLNAELARKGIAKKELAKCLDVRPATIYEKLNGKYGFTLDEAMKIRNELFPGLTIEYLFALDENIG